jgi:ABC-type antimicrobial peptide transport system permease subunit
MSFTVARRTREIGIRTALGARPWQVLAGIFARASAQLGIGVLVGSAMGAYLASDVLAAGGVAPLVVSMMVPLAVGLVACAVPAARALRVQPTVALREN